jgi:membrane-associated protease RseP (regulator of RpoE activity)
MKIPIMWIVLIPVLLGGTACSREAGGQGVIVQVENRDNPSGWLGVSIQDMTSRLARAMDAKTREGALVNEVVEDSPAEDAGLKDEDIIVELDGKKVSNADDLRTMVKATRPGTKISLAVIRKNERKTLEVTIGKKPRSRSYSYSFTPPSLPRIPRTPRIPMHIEIFRDAASLGMTLSTLTEQLGKYFGAPDGKGVLVQEVEKDSKAAEAGFLAGDVITEVGKETIEESSDVVDALRDRDEGEKVDIRIIRKGTAKTLTLEVPDMKRHGRHWFGFRDGNWFNDFDIEIDPPDIDVHPGHERGELREWLDDVKKELNEMKYDIQKRVEELRRNLETAVGV